MWCLPLKQNYHTIHGKIISGSFRAMLLNKYYSEIAPVTELKFPFFLDPNFAFLQAMRDVTNGSTDGVATTVYTGHVQNTNMWMSFRYHTKLERIINRITNSLGHRKNVQEILSKSTSTIVLYILILYIAVNGIVNKVPYWVNICCLIVLILCSCQPLSITINR